MNVPGYAAAVLLMAAAILLPPAPATAHGMHYSLEPSEDARVFKAGFSGGEVAAYAECVIYGPRSGPESGPEFQNGRTDATGRFAFVPDRDGIWRVVVKGGMGHRLEFEIPVNRTAAETALATPTTLGNGLGTGPEKELGTELSTGQLLMRAGLGASLIANLFLFPAVLRRKKNSLR